MNVRIEPHLPLSGLIFEIFFRSEKIDRHNAYLMRRIRLSDFYHTCIFHHVPDNAFRACHDEYGR